MAFSCFGPVIVFRVRVELLGKTVQFFFLIYSYDIRQPTMDVIIDYHYCKLYS